MKTLTSPWLVNTSTASMVHEVKSEVRRGIDVPRGVVVVLQRALEWVACCSPTWRTGLLGGNTADLIAHQTIILLVGLLSSPDTIRDQAETCQDDEATNTYHDTNDGGLRLAAQPARARGAVTGKGGRRGGGGRSARG